MADMIQLEENHSDGTTIATTNPLDIGIKAHDYYDSLFHPVWTTPAEIADETWVTDMINEEFDLWMYDIGTTGQLVIECADACPRKKTTGRDMLTTEHWQTRFHTHPSVAAHMAWIFNQRLMNMHTHFDEEDDDARRDATNQSHAPTTSLPTCATSHATNAPPQQIDTTPVRALAEPAGRGALSPKRVSTGQGYAIVRTTNAHDATLAGHRTTHDAHTHRPTHLPHLRKQRRPVRQPRGDHPPSTHNYPPPPPLVPGQRRRLPGLPLQLHRHT